MDITERAAERSSSSSSPMPGLSHEELEAIRNVVTADVIKALQLATPPAPHRPVRRNSCPTISPSERQQSCPGCAEAMKELQAVRAHVLLQSELRGELEGRLEMLERQAATGAAPESRGPLTPQPTGVGAVALPELEAQLASLERSHSILEERVSAALDRAPALDAEPVENGGVSSIEAVIGRLLEMEETLLSKAASIDQLRTESTYNANVAEELRKQVEQLEARVETLQENHGSRSSNAADALESLEEYVHLLESGRVRGIEEQLQGIYQSVADLQADLDASQRTVTKSLNKRLKREWERVGSVMREAECKGGDLSGFATRMRVSEEALNVLGERIRVLDAAVGDILAATESGRSGAPHAGSNGAGLLLQLEAVEAELKCSLLRLEQKIMVIEGGVSSGPSGGSVAADSCGILLQLEATEVHLKTEIEELAQRVLGLEAKATMRSSSSPAGKETECTGEDPVLLELGERVDALEAQMSVVLDSHQEGIASKIEAINLGAHIDQKVASWKPPAGCSAQWSKLCKTLIQQSKLKALEAWHRKHSRQYAKLDAQVCSMSRSLLQNSALLEQHQQANTQLVELLQSPNRSPAPDTRIQRLEDAVSEQHQSSLLQGLDVTKAASDVALLRSQVAAISESLLASSETQEQQARELQMLSSTTPDAAYSDPDAASESSGVLRSLDSRLRTIEDAFAAQIQRLEEEAFLEVLRPAQGESSSVKMEAEVQVEFEDFCGNVVQGRVLSEEESGWVPSASDRESE